MTQKYKPVPPVRPRAADDEDVKRIDGLVKLGVTQRKIASHLEIHHRTVFNIVHRIGAYEHIPKEAA